MMNTSIKLDNMVVRQSEMMNDVKMMLAMSHRREHMMFQMLQLSVGVFEGFFEQANKFLTDNGGTPFNYKMIESIKELMQSWVMKPAWAEQEKAEDYLKQAENEKQRAEEEYSDIAKVTVEDLGKTFPPPSVFKVEEQGTAFHLDASWLPKTILEHALDMDPCDKYLALGPGWRNLVEYPKGNADYPGLALPSATNDAVLENICEKFNEEAAKEAATEEANDDLDDGMDEVEVDENGEPVLVIPLPSKPSGSKKDSSTQPKSSKGLLKKSKDTAKKAKNSKDAKAKKQEAHDESTKIRPTGKPRALEDSSDDDFEEPKAKAKTTKKSVEEVVEEAESKADKKPRRQNKKRRKKSSSERRHDRDLHAPHQEAKETDKPKKTEKPAKKVEKTVEKKVEKKSDKKAEKKSDKIVPMKDSSAFSDAMDNPVKGKSAKRNRPSSSGSEPGAPVSKQRKVTLDNESLTLRKEDEGLISADKVNVKVTVDNVPPKQRDLREKIPHSNLRNILTNKFMDKALFAQEERNVPDSPRGSSKDTSISTLVISSTSTTPARREDREAEADLSSSCDGEYASPQGGDDVMETESTKAPDPDENVSDQEDGGVEEIYDHDDDAGSTSEEDEEESIKNKKKVESSSLLQDLLRSGSGLVKVFGRDRNDDPYDKALIADREKLEESNRANMDNEDAQDTPTVVEVASTESVEVIKEIKTLE